MTRSAEVKVGRADSISALLIYPCGVAEEVSEAALGRRRHSGTLLGTEDPSMPLSSPTRRDPALVGAAPLEVSDLFRREREARRVLAAVTSRSLPGWNDWRPTRRVSSRESTTGRCLAAFFSGVFAVVWHFVKPTVTFWNQSDHVTTHVSFIRWYFIRL